jgi:thiamine monophosphate kinase
MRRQIKTDDWVAMFREIGLSQAQMETWHKLFEKRHPEDHQRFLEWLNLRADEVAEIRSKYR